MAIATSLKTKLREIEAELEVQLKALKQAQDSIGAGPIDFNAIAGELKHTVNNLRHRRQKLKAQLK